MSRRKQSNPKPLKWEECWNEAEEGESRVGKKVTRDVACPITRPNSASGYEGSMESTLRLRDRARSLRLTSGSCDVEITRIRQKCGDTNSQSTWTQATSGGTPKRSASKMQGRNHSPVDLEPEDSQSQNLSTDLTKKHDSMSLSRSPEISVPSTEHNGSPGPFSHHQILQAGLSYLHLLPPAIRNDASRYFMPHMLPPELTSVASVSGSPQQTPTIKNEKVAVDNTQQRSGPVYMCEPCGIKFSSARTLEAHQTYYCSFRKDNGKDADKSIAVEPKSESEVVGIKRERESSGEERELLIDETEDRDGNSNMTHSNIPVGNKNIKTGKLYTCIYCSYSADKKVSLNRHMRMHSGASMPNSSQASSSQQQQQTVNVNPNDELCGTSPSVSSYSSGKNTSGANGADGSGNAVERYCQDCDIQFSSIKTFRVHKQYYCSTRHVLKTQLGATSSCQPAKSGNGVELSNCSGGSSTPGLVRKGSGSPARSPTPGPGPLTPIPANQPFLVLPTNPVIIVPYCFIQGASILPGNILPNQNAIVVLPNGVVQGLPVTPMMMSSPSHSLGAAAAAMMMQQQQHTNPFSNHSSGGGNNPNMNSNSGGTVTTMNISPTSGAQTLASGVFNDPKDIIRKIGGKTRRNPSDSDSQRSSSRCQSEKDTDGDCCAELEVIAQHAPAIDLTLRAVTAGNQEKENRELMSIAGRRVRSLTPNDPDYNRELNSPNSEMHSTGSGKSNERTPRPSSASLSSSCSSPPGHCFTENSTSAKLLNGAKTSIFGTHVSGKSTSVAAMLQQQQFPSPNSKGFSANKHGSGLDYNYNSNIHDKIRPIATQLPGGAILTSTSNQSLSELLMSNPPELNESLNKLNSQLVMNSASAVAATGGFNLPPPGAFPPELAMRLMDPTYLAALQHSFQQQQRQQQQQLKQATAAKQHQQQTQPPAPAKRGVSKCIDCDIVFYKYENYLVHKERYCAARESVIGSKDNQSGECANSHSAVKESISSNSSTKSDCDGDGAQCLSPPVEFQHQKRTSRPRVQQQQMSSGSRSLRKSAENSMEIIGNTTTAVMISPSKMSMKVNSGSPPSPNAGNGNKEAKLQQQSNQYPCLKCGVKYSTFDNLQTHQAFYCNKRGATNVNSNISEPNPSPKSNGENIFLAEQGFLRCGKCRLAIPEEQMNLHSTVCQQIPVAGSGNTLMTTLTNTGATGTASLGWKCPCCETYSPTMSAAQKHLETHTGIRAFKCLLCGYRGNTLRGMRTHIRMHFDKRVSDLQEGDYIACITSKDLEHTQGAISTVLTSAAANAAVHAVTTTTTATPTMLELNSVKIEKESPVVIHNVSTSPPPSQSPEGSPSQSQLSPSAPIDISTSSIRQVENNNRLHFCHLCNYSSSYKGNVVRHMKLVHKIAEDFPDLENDTGAGNTEDRNGDFDDSCGSFGSRSRSPDHSISPSLEISAKYQVPLANNKGIVSNAQSPKLKVNGMMEKKCSSRLSAPAIDSPDLDDEGVTALNKNKKEKSCAVKYCKPCNLYFNYLSTFIAHKKLYCPSQARPVSDSEPLEQRERAETPVQ